MSLEASQNLAMARQMLEQQGELNRVKAELERITADRDALHEDLIRAQRKLKDIRAIAAKWDFIAVGGQLREVLDR